MKDYDDTNKDYYADDEDDYGYDYYYDLDVSILRSAAGIYRICFCRPIPSLGYECRSGADFAGGVG